MSEKTFEPKIEEQVNDDGKLGTRLAMQKGEEFENCVDHPGFEPKRYSLDTLENCRLLLSNVLYSVTNSEMDLSMGKFAADVAKKAADTLIKGDKDEAGTSKILEELAKIQPALTSKSEPSVAKVLYDEDKVS